MFVGGGSLGNGALTRFASFIIRAQEVRINFNTGMDKSAKIGRKVCESNPEYWTRQKGADKKYGVD